MLFEVLRSQVYKSTGKLPPLAKQRSETTAAKREPMLNPFLSSNQIEDEEEDKMAAGSDECEIPNERNLQRSYSLKRNFVADNFEARVLPSTPGAEGGSKNIFDRSRRFGKAEAKSGTDRRAEKYHLGSSNFGHLPRKEWVEDEENIGPEFIDLGIREQSRKIALKK